MGKTLLTPSEQDDLYFEFGRDAVTRTDIKTRYEAYKIAREIGDLSVDEIRSFENRSSVQGGDTRI
ncbi:phage portal protein, partial [Burkholderia pseudomallei]